MSDESADARADREAADWLVRLSRPAVAYTDLTAFYAWKKDPANALAYARAEALWSRSAKLSDNKQVQDAVRDALDRKPLVRRIAFASSAVIGAIAVALVLLLWLNATGAQEFATRAGERRQVVLEDGSAVLLDTATEITVDYGADQRAVRLNQGRVRVAVQHGDQRVFTVDVAGIKVVATGTRFDVRDDGIISSVTLLSGGVRLDAGAQGSRALAVGQTAIIKGGNVVTVRRTLPQDSAWADGSLVFDRTPLGQAIAEMNRYSQRPITLASPGLADREISGIFDAGDTEGFVTAVRAMFDLDRTEDGTGRIELKRARS